MPNTLEGKDVSLWVETTSQTNYPTLGSDTEEYDVAIVGGGITGIVSAYLLQQAGLKVVLLEKSRIVEWTTGDTTAKLSSQHYLIYSHLIERQGQVAAQAFADANQHGIDKIESLSQELDIDCDFSRRNAYVYSQQDDKNSEIKAEVEAAKKLGLPASFETETDLPFNITAAVKFSDQAQFHPRKFLLPLAERFVKSGGKIYEQTKAEDIEPRETNPLKTDKGDIKAKHIIQASGAPFWKSEIFDGFMWEKVSYALAVKLKNEEDYPKDMYITTDCPMRTLRSAAYEDESVMIFGGESHEFNNETFEDDMKLHYQNLITDVHKRFDVEKILFRWLASDNMPYDRMPYIGAVPGHENIHVITGYRAWGLAWAMSAAEAIVGDITKKPVDWVGPFRLDRLAKPLGESDRVQGL